MEEAPEYRLDWDNGASIDIDIFIPKDQPGQTLRSRYTPAFRGTYRSSVLDSGIKSHDLEFLFREHLRRTKLPAEAFISRDPCAKESAGPASATSREATPESRPELGQLFQSLFRQHDGTALHRRENAFLSFSLDESLVQFPWELMHDGTDFLCLNHRMGRLVNSSESTPASMNDLPWRDQSLEKPSVLVIGADSPMQGFSELPGARREAEAIAERLKTSGLGLRVRSLLGREATHQNVRAVLSEEFGNTGIIHFCGHGHWDANGPSESNLVLHDQLLGTDLIAGGSAEKRPFLCFINACGSAAPNAPTENFDVYDIGRAFLKNGACVLGSRWPVEPKAATAFALNFYDSLVGQGISIGESVRLARVQSRKAFPENFDWASYVFYGDPRIRLNRIHTPFGLSILRSLDRELVAELDEPWAGLSREGASARQSSGFYDKLFYEAPVGLTLCRIDGTFVAVNKLFADIVGRTVEEMLQLSYYDITPIEYREDERQALRNIERQEHFGPYDKQYIHKANHRVPVRQWMRPVTWRGKRYIWSIVERPSLQTTYLVTPATTAPPLEPAETSTSHPSDQAPESESPATVGAVAEETSPVRCTLLSYAGEWAYCQANASGAVLPVKFPAELLRSHGLDAASTFFWFARYGGGVGDKDIMSCHGIEEPQLAEDEAARVKALIEEHEKIPGEALREYFNEGRPRT